PARDLQGLRRALMPINITMPALSPTMTDGKLAKWLKKEGDSVSAGDPIAEIETDKATMEVEAVDEGTLAKILVPEGTENVAVITVIGVLLEEGEDDSALADAGKQSKSKGGDAAPAKPEAPRAESKPHPKSEAEAPKAAPKPAPKAAAQPSGRGDGQRVFA